MRVGRKERRGKKKTRSLARNSHSRSSRASLASSPRAYFHLFQAEKVCVKGEGSSAK